MTTPLIVSFGQRKTIMCTLPFVIVAWVTHAVTPNVWLLQVTRALLGISQGIHSYCLFTYVVEITHSKYRSTFCGAIDLVRQSGLLFIFCVGSSALHWRQVALIAAFSGTIIPFVIFLFIPDSPRWLAVQNRIEDADKALVFFRGKKYDTKSELSHITTQLSESNVANDVLSQLGLIVKDRSILKRVLIMTYFSAANRLNGNVVIVSYSAMIFKAVPSSIDEYSSTIMIGVARVLAVLSYGIISMKLGRKTLATVPIFICGVCMIGMGTLSFLGKKGYNLPILLWLPLILMMIYVFSICFSVSILNLYRSELIPNSVRQVVGPCITIMAIFSFLTTYFFQTMIEYFGMYGTFWTFGINCIVSALMAYILLPETKGKSLEEIDDAFRGK